MVPIDEGDIVFSGFPVIDVDGSQTIHAEANALGLDECLIVVDGAGHVPHAADPTHYDLTLSSIAGKLGECWALLPCHGGGHMWPANLLWKG